VAAEPVGPARDAAFEHALEVLRNRRDEFNAQGFVPRDYVDQLKRAGLYRASTPKRFGGDELPPADFLRRIEAISTIDPATGWVASFGSSLIYLAALPLETQAELYADGPDVAFAGALFPMQPAEPADGGYRVTGSWLFGSGCRGADVLGVGLAGGPASQGRPMTAVLRPDQVEIIDNWDVAGMKATGSHELRVKDVFVPDAWTFVRGGEATVDGPLYRYPALAYAAQVLAVTALGAARGALDHVREVGSPRTSITGGPPRAVKPNFQSGLARAEARLRSARAWFFEATDALYELAVAGAKPTRDQVGLLRLAASHAAHEGRRVTLAAYDLAGTGAIYRTHPLQRFLQDALVPAQHAFLQDATYEAAGGLLLGLDPSLPSFP